jgi:hypothetical protein
MLDLAKRSPWVLGALLVAAGFALGWMANPTARSCSEAADRCGAVVAYCQAPDSLPAVLERVSDAAANWEIANLELRYRTDSALDEGMEQCRREMVSALKWELRDFR